MWVQVAFDIVGYDVKKPSYRTGIHSDGKQVYYFRLPEALHNGTNGKDEKVSNRCFP